LAACSARRSVDRDYQLVPQLLNMIQSSGAPLANPVDSTPARTYADRLSEGVLAYQRCVDCKSAVFYPRAICPACGSTGLVWQVSSGRGTVYSTTSVSRRDAAPYCVCLVDLDDGFRLMSTVVGIPAEEVQIGQRVQGRVDLEGAEPRPIFEVEATR
jgi:uncharacterized OB-fold protein